jgi:hypothetical protein
LFLLGGCTSLDPEGSRLRVVNGGSVAILKLTVLFPEDQITFGDIPAGATSAYREAPNGVYRYAAYRLELDGATVTQPVIDWVGETPMEGEAFTYTLSVDPRRSPAQIVQVVSVTRDE